jgi:hypothetical protein
MASENATETAVTAAAGDARGRWLIGRCHEAQS